MLLNAGAREGIKKEPRLFNIPIVNAAMEIINKKGNSSLVRLVAKVDDSLLKPGAIRLTRIGDTAIPAIVTIRAVIINMLIACRASEKAFSFPFSSRTFEKTGMNAAERAPSARSWRKRFERVYAILNASSCAVAPKYAAVIISRSKPRIRLAKVPAIMKRAWRTMCEEFVLSLDLFESVVSCIKSSKQIQVWGIGNTLLGDDAIGPMVSIQLGGIDCGTTPENYTSKLRKIPPETLIIIDAAEMGLKAGSVRMLNFDDLGDSIVTSHGIPLSVLFEQFRKTVNIFFIGIQPKQTNLGEPISTEVKAAADFIVEKLSKPIFSKHSNYN
jgi:hydrogenase 3 maturation protease